MEPVRLSRAADAGQPELHGLLPFKPLSSLSPLQLRVQASLYRAPASGRAGALFSAEASGNGRSGGVWRVAGLSVFRSRAFVSEPLQHRACGRTDSVAGMGLLGGPEGGPVEADPGLWGDSGPSGYSVRAADISMRRVVDRRFGALARDGVQGAAKGGIRYSAGINSRGRVRSCPGGGTDPSDPRVASALHPLGRIRLQYRIGLVHASDRVAQYRHPAPFGESLYHERFGILGGDVPQGTRGISGFFFSRCRLGLAVDSIYILPSKRTEADSWGSCRDRCCIRPGRI